MMSYSPLRQNTTSKPSLATSPQDEDDEILISLQNIPSNFDQALNGSTPSQTFLSPNPPKNDNTSLLDPEAFRRFSTSTISSFQRGRSISPYPSSHLSVNLTTARTWRSLLASFWESNQPLFLVALSQLFGALMNVTTRLLELEGEGMDPFQILFARQGLTALFCTAWMWWKKIDGFPLGHRGVRGLLLARACSGFFGIFGMYYSLQYLPIADAVVITFLAPSVAAYGCYIFFGEPFPRAAQYASLVSLLGVVLIAQPFSSPSSHSSIATKNASNTTTPLDSSVLNLHPPTVTQRLSAVAIALIGVLGAAGAFTTIRFIGTRAHPFLSVNYFSTFCLVISTLVLTLSKPLGISDLEFELPKDLRQWSMLIFLGMCGFVMQYLLTRGIAGGKGGRAGGSRATNMIYTNMLFALALDKLVFGQSPGWWSLAGSGLILGSAVYVALGKAPDSEGNVIEDEVAVVGGRRDSVRERERGRGIAVGTEDEEMAMLGRDGAVFEEEDVDLRDVDTTSIPTHTRPRVRI